MRGIRRSCISTLARSSSDATRSRKESSSAWPVRYQLSSTDSSWYKARQLAQLYDSACDGLIHLCRPRADGRRINWDHVVQLLQVKDSAKREDQADQAVADHLSSDELRNRIQAARKEGNKRPGSGRRRKVPKRLAEALGHARRDLESLKFYLAAAIKLSRNPAKEQLLEAQAILVQLGQPLSPAERAVK